MRYKDWLNKMSSKPMTDAQWEKMLRQYTPRQVRFAWYALIYYPFGYVAVAWSSVKLFEQTTLYPFDAGDVLLRVMVVLLFIRLLWRAHKTLFS